ncbi:hypothetical protein DF185_18165 [Marinifilum breve]|uniref:Fibronectin type-III domain-containing protein n=1 Tax=Marinifilum breve TaxID=2184082 RepID=A0A2V3ZXP0_9BACT|nr:T9SS type A sorting domain-containing protein [Marinifilum breve]PXX97893.1 hypothetical protein DF185_18165 [Marinifilum breve]
MKKTFTLLFVILLLTPSLTIKGQEFTFNSSYNNDNKPPCNAFLEENKDMLNDQDWRSTHGSPTIGRSSKHSTYSLVQLIARNFNKSERSEGISHPYIFKKGHVYEIQVVRRKEDVGYVGYSIYMSNNPNKNKDTLCVEYSIGFHPDSHKLVYYNKDVKSTSFGKFESDLTSEFSPCKNYSHFSISSKRSSEFGNGSGTLSINSILILDKGKESVAPSIPKNIRALNETTNSFKLSWDKSTDNYCVKGYKIYLNGKYEKTVTTNSYTFKDLASYTAFNIKIKAFDAAGNESGFSSEISTRTLYDEPELVITGSINDICNNSTRSFSTLYIPNTTYTWIVGPGLSIQSNGSSNVTVTSNSSYKGSTYIKVRRVIRLEYETDKDRISPIIKNFYIGTKPPTRIDILDPQTGNYITGHELQTGKRYKFHGRTSNTTIGVTDYFWRMTPPASSNISSETNSGELIYYTALNPGYHQFTVKQKGTCGWSSYYSTDYFFEGNSSGGGGGPITGDQEPKGISFDNNQINLQPEGNSMDENNTTIIEVNEVQANLLNNQTNLKSTHNKKHIEIYPNPANKYININMPNSDLTTIRVLNTSGQVLISRKIKGSSKINIENLNNGLYIIHIIGDNYSTTKKLMVSK